eukprot:gene8442-9343_t
MDKCVTNLGVSSELRITLGITNSVIGLLALLGNLLMFVIIYKNKRLQTRSNTCLLSLAMTDFLVGIILEPMHVMQLFSATLRYNCTFNTVRRFLATFLLCASIMSIALISYDRCMHLIKTVNYPHHMSRMKIAFLILFCWTLPAALPFIRFAGESLYCAAIILLIASVFLTMVICYYFIMKVVRNTSRNITPAVEVIDDEQRETRRETRSHIRVAKAIAIIIIIFGLLFTPIAVFMSIVSFSALPFIDYKGFHGNVKEVCYAVAMTTAMANSAINPAVYYFRIPEFKEKLKMLFGIEAQTQSLSGSVEKGNLAVVGEKSDTKTVSGDLSEETALTVST